MLALFGKGSVKCPNNKIKACDKFLHCEITCSCDYRGKKFISGAISVNQSFHSTYGERKGARLPILLIKMYTPRVEKRVYALIDTGSEETLISKKAIQRNEFIWCAITSFVCHHQR